MQVRFGLAGRVLSFAPKEIEAPLIRTLAIIAYKQPIKQSDLVEIRGNKSYDHVKELEKRGLISAVRHSRTKLLTTTRGFADYFGINSCNPEAVRRALLQEKKLVGVSPMFESLALRLGLDFIVVNPYKPESEDLSPAEGDRSPRARARLRGAGEGELLGRDSGGQRSHSFSTQGERRDDRPGCRMRGCRAPGGRGGLLAEEIPEKGKDGQSNQAADPHDRGDRPRPSAGVQRTASELHRIQLLWRRRSRCRSTSPTIWISWRGLCSAARRSWRLWERNNKKTKRKGNCSHPNQGEISVPESA